jgi:hypothetical protein
MVKLLPPECLLTIFKYFKDDKKTLHSCLLVDRYWSSCVVPLLWNHPFELSKRPSSKLIETYSKFFDKESQELLLSRGILIKPIRKSTIFDYPRFIRSLQYNYVYEFSSVWLQEGQSKGHQKYFTGLETTKMLRIFVKELFKLFFNKNPVIESLSFNVVRFLEAPDIAGSRLVNRFRPYRDVSYTKRAFEYISSFGEDLIEILSYEDSKSSLNNLQILEFGANKYDIIIMKLFKDLIKTVDTLKFNFTPELRNSESEVCEMMQNLVKESIYLKKVSIRYGSQHVPGMISALNFHVHNLTELSFEKIDFNAIPSPETIFSTISLCVNLEKLIISNCQGVNNEVISPLSNATFRCLETLIFTKIHNPINDIFRAVLAGLPRNQNNPVSLEPLTNVISSTNGNLKVLLLGRNLLYSRDLPDEFVVTTTYPPEDVMDAISLSCHNLTIFEIHIRSDILPQVFTILESTYQLDRFMFSAELELVDDEYFWRNLSDVLPVSLKDLTISIGPVFWLEVLHWLFENMKCKLEVLQFPLSVFMDDEYLCIIAQYAKLLGGTIKILALNNSNKITQKGLSYALRVIEDITNTGEYNDNYNYLL